MNFDHFRDHYHTDLHATIDRMVAIALDEDLNLAAGGKDITAQLIASDTEVCANLICREDATLCGRAWFDTCFHCLDDSIDIEWLFKDGDDIQKNDLLCTIKGSAREILSAERSAMNFLQTLSGTASQTRRYVQQLDNTNCKLLDTRKTLPGFRMAQKYAVLCGGGQNHRIGLFDAYLIKENHIRACGSIAAAIQTARQQQPGTLLEIEVESLEELELALTNQPDVVMLDNFDLETLRQAVAMNSSHCQLEASGNITLATITQVANTGVDYISVGAITKNIRAVDLSLLIQK